MISCLENKLLLISINFTPKTSHSCLKKWYTMFSRWSQKFAVCYARKILSTACWLGTRLNEAKPTAVDLSLASYWLMHAGFRVWFEVNKQLLAWKRARFFLSAGKVSQGYKAGWIGRSLESLLEAWKWGKNREKSKEDLRKKPNTQRLHVDVSKNSGTPKSSHFNRVFHYKPSILGYPYFWKHPCMEYLPTFTINLGHSCRSIFQSHGSYAVGDPWIVGHKIVINGVK